MSLQVDLLSEIGQRVRTHIVTRRASPDDREIVGFEGGDTIYGIDKAVHSLIESVCRDYAGKHGRLEVVAEGFGETGRISFFDEKETVGHLLIDPIDGTRGLMYDMRSAWFLAAWCDPSPNRPFAEMADAAIMMELPTTKQTFSDVITYSKHLGVVAERHEVHTEVAERLMFGPSMAKDLHHGFVCVSDFFFPGTGTLASELANFIVENCTEKVVPGSAVVFNDQYISSGGQLAELVLGRYRFCVDLRPLFYSIIEHQTGVTVSKGLQCHPYDLASIRIAMEAGVVVTDGYGGVLKVPFSIDQPMHWRAYANPDIHALVDPIVDLWLQRKLS